jgi:hypothetical protein
MRVPGEAKVGGCPAVQKSSGPEEMRFGGDEGRKMKVVRVWSRENLSSLSQIRI